MTDTHTKEQRRQNMAAICSKNTKPEIAVRSMLHRCGYRFRIHRSDLPGKPDLVLPKYRTVIEVRGCFWHRHPGCSRATMPSSNVQYWSRKFERTINRDRKNIKLLNLLKWEVINVWECELKNPEKALTKIVELLENGSNPSFRKS